MRMISAQFVNFEHSLVSMLQKKKVLQSIEELPDVFSVDEVIDRIILLHKIEMGIEQIDAQKGLSNTKAKQRLKKWLK